MSLAAAVLRPTTLGDLVRRSLTLRVRTPLYACGVGPPPSL